MVARCGALSDAAEHRRGSVCPLARESYTATISVFVARGSVRRVSFEMSTCFPKAITYIICPLYCVALCGETSLDTRVFPSAYSNY